MKKQKLNPQTLSFLLLAFSFLLTTSMQCKKDQTGIDALPPATQEGKEAFGCLINGEVFTPKGSNLGGPILSSYYQYLNSSTAQGYFFNVSASRKNGGNKGTESVAINSNNKSIVQGRTYSLKNSESSGEIYGNYGFFSGIEINNYSTTGIYQGELYISKFDEINQIVSGTFWFDAVNDKDEKVEVREGRFDVHYVK
jgi:hypothetical protein